MARGPTRAAVNPVAKEMDVGSLREYGDTLPTKMIRVKSLLLCLCILYGSQFSDVVLARSSASVASPRGGPRSG